MAFVDLNYPAADAQFNWDVLRDGERTIRIVSKKDKQEPFPSIWDATSTAEADMYKLDRRSELTYDNVAVNSFVLVEAVREIPRINDIQSVFMILPPAEPGSHMAVGRYFRRVHSSAYAEIQAEGRNVSVAAPG